MKRTNYFLLGWMILFSGVACQNNPEPLSDPPELREKNSLSDFSIKRVFKVVDSEGRFVSNAKFYIGDTNFIIGECDMLGVCEAPNTWQTPQTLTFEANGHMTTSFINQSPKTFVGSGRTYSIRLSELPPSIEIRGITTGYENYIVDKDSIVDFGVVIPAIKKNEIHFFNENNILSPEMDHFSVLGKKIFLPSNIGLPRQKEKYGIFTITLNKAEHRLKVDRPGSYSLMALRAKAQLKTLQETPPPLQLINELQFGGLGKKVVDVSESGAISDLSVNEVNFTAQVVVKAPSLPPDLVMLSLPLSQSGEYLYVSDVKSLKSEEAKTLNAPMQGADWLLNVVTKFDTRIDKAASAALFDLKNHTQPQVFLGLIEKPSLVGNSLKLSMPELPVAVQPNAMYITLQKVTIDDSGPHKLETSQKLWEIFVESWSNQVTLPAKAFSNLDFLRARGLKTVYRWEVAFLGQWRTDSSAATRQMTGEVLTDVFTGTSFLSRNSFDF